MKYQLKKAHSFHHTLYCPGLLSLPNMIANLLIFCLLFHVLNLLRQSLDSVAGDVQLLQTHHVAEGDGEVLQAVV